jgi:hypothetical protein
MCSLQIEVITGTSACTRTAFQFKAIKRFLFLQNTGVLPLIYSFGSYALLGCFKSAVNSLAQRDLLVKRNLFFSTVGALIVKKISE